MEYNPFELIRKIYQKEDISDITNIDTSMCIIISKYLSYDKDNLPILKKLVHFIFYIEGINYIYLLWLSIPKKDRVPFLKKIDKKEEKKIKLYEEIKEVLEWSERELQFNKSILDKVIMPYKKYWEKEFGI